MGTAIKDCRKGSEAFAALLGVAAVLMIPDPVALAPLLTSLFLLGAGVALRAVELFWVHWHNLTGLRVTLSLLALVSTWFATAHTAWWIAPSALGALLFGSLASLVVAQWRGWVR